MKVNSISWAKCPKCKITMNGWQFYPANIVMHGYSNLFTETKCPNKKCGEMILVAAKVEVTLEAIESEPDNLR